MIRKCLYAIEIKLRKRKILEDIVSDSLADDIYRARLLKHEELTTEKFIIIMNL